jgi:hypothetical protein
MTDMSLAHRNDFLNTVGDIMDDPTFKAFFECYFNDWDDCIAAVMLLKAYQSIDRHTNLTKEDKVKLLRQQMNNSEFRQQLAKGMIDFMNNHTKSTKSKSKSLLSLPF